MNYGSFKSYLYDPGYNSTLIIGVGSLPINIKVAQLSTFANSDTKQQGYWLTEENKLISTMLTGWNRIGNGGFPKSMSNNYVELILSCDNGFVVKKRLQFPHIIAWHNDSTQYQIADVYKEFSIDNWLKADDFENPDITLVVEPTDEILTTSTKNPPEATTTNSGRFYLYYRNLPVGVNRVHIDFHIKTQTEPIDFDLEIKDGKFYANPLEENATIFLKNLKEFYQYRYNGPERPLEEITPYGWQQLYADTEVYFPDNKITHDLFFYPYV